MTTPAATPAAVAGAAPAPGAGLVRRSAGAAAPLALGLGVLVVWEVAVRALGIRPILLPPPSAIAAAVVQDLPRLAGATWVTGRSALLGFAIGAGGGFLAGLAASRWRPLREAVVPVGVVLGSLPIVATAPIFNLWFGALSIWSKVAVVALVVFFPVLVNTVAGLASAPASSQELLRSYAAPGRTVLTALQIPSALPFVFGALRVAAALSVIAAVVAEFFGGFRDSAGFFIKTLMANADYTGAWATVVALSAFGLALFGAVALAERVAMPWRRDDRGVRT